MKIFDFKTWIDDRLQLEAKQISLGLDGIPICPSCGGHLVKRNGQYGEFYGCANFRDGCRGTATLLQYNKAIEQPQQPTPPQQRQPMPTRLDISNRLGGEIPGTPVQNASQQGTWIYAKAVKYCAHFSKGQQLALKGPLSTGGWAFRILDNDPTKAKSGVITKEEAAGGLIAAYRDDANTPLKSTNPNNPTLEDLRKQLRLDLPQEPQEEPQKEPEKQSEPAAEGTNGRPSPESCRFPPEFMNEYTQKIQDRFLNTNKGMCLSALAGTGKTSNLKHLASFIKPGEKWLYLVFNKKNQVESVNEFPNGVPA